MTYTANPNYWSILGVTPGSSSDELKLAFRKEARKWHPDLNANDRNAEERFKLINEAYAVLSDSVRRKAWESDFKNQSISNNLFEEGFPEFYDYLNVILGLETSRTNQPEDIYVDNYEQPNIPTKAPPSPPPIQTYEDQETLIELTPDQALYGTTIDLELQNGLTVEVDTPAFAGDGWRLRLEGVAKGGRDHFLQLRVQTEEGLRIDGLRVLYRLELFPPEAVLGCAVDVPTLDGLVTLQVPPRSSSGRLLRLRQRGLEFDGITGDQIVEVVVVIPSDISDSESALYQRLHELSFEQDID